ncbi:MAG: hypothetical protein SynsKO_08100 [Synoicihabitans sp.]
MLLGWTTRAELREDTMIAESLRLVESAHEFVRTEGVYANSINNLGAVESTDRLIAWVAGDSVRYMPFEDGFIVGRGGMISELRYSSYSGNWELAKR